MCNQQFYPKDLTPIETGLRIAEHLVGLRRTMEEGETRLYEFTAPAALFFANVSQP
ncbi:MAG: hypothetical protein ACREBU_09790 [Nitrososphaera sp.]